MKKYSLYLIALMSFTVIVSSCGEEDAPAPVPIIGYNYEYAPSNIGHEVIYDVSLITKDEFSGAQDTSIYQLKEVIESVFNDIAGRPTQRIERFTRLDASQPWVIADVWTANLMDDRYEKKEENTAFVKLRFPISNGLVWNGHLYNTLSPQDFSYSNTNSPDIVNGINFDSTLTVLQSDYEDLLEKVFAVEQYATGVGLIYKESVYIKKDFNNPGAIKAQTKYRQTVVSFSN
jgi:hypothetical protein